MGESLFWYDLETFGTNPRIDRIAQFAGIRTNDRFEPIEEPVVLYCKITPDYLPDPAACLVTGITPNETLRKGTNEYEFISTINGIFSVRRRIYSECALPQSAGSLRTGVQKRQLPIRHHRFDPHGA